jgi:predicted flap endonuclease-1-like 5' DNA nuclease
VRYVLPDDFEVEVPDEDEAVAPTGDDSHGWDDRDERNRLDTPPASGVDEGDGDWAAVDAEIVRSLDTDDDEEGADPDGRGLQRLGGVGSTYADRLRAAGYRTLSDLAEADPVAVAEAASVPPGRGRRWVAAAIRTEAGGRTDDESGREDETDEPERAEEGVDDESHDPDDESGGEEERDRDDD